MCSLWIILNFNKIMTYLFKFEINFIICSIIRNRNVINMREEIKKLQNEITSCSRCPRLRSYCLEVAKKKKNEFRDWLYWGKPVPPSGDEEAQLLIIGLAPAAHGANRTGRMFTGNGSGKFLISPFMIINLPISLHLCIRTMD